jgi:nitric oxide reductase subunit C
MYAADPAFWRAGAISSTAVMLVVLAFLTVDSLATIRAGGTNVPAYTVINQQIGYEFDAEAHRYRPVIGADQPLFGRAVSAREAEALMRKGKLVIQSRNCLACSQ